MADKPIQLISGRLTQVEATVTSAGTDNAGDVVALDATGRLSVTVLPVGVGADTKSILASENLAGGDFVAVWNDSGTTKVRKADATTSGKEADGFVKDAVTSGNAALIYFEGTNTSLSGLTPGARYYLATTAGQATATPPSASGNVSQHLGRAVSDTELSFEPDAGVVLA